jgi:hypothetical protein
MITKYKIKVEAQPTGTMIAHILISKRNIDREKIQRDENCKSRGKISYGKFFYQGCRMSVYKRWRRRLVRMRKERQWKCGVKVGETTPYPRWKIGVLHAGWVCDYAHA